MDLLEELNRMAANVGKLNNAGTDEENVEMAQREDVTREPISDEHWNLVKADREAAGYDREAYEHSLTLKDVLQSQSTVFHDTDGKKWTLYKIGGLLGSKEKVQEIAELKEAPKITKGIGSMGMYDFVWVDDKAREKIESWVEMQQLVGKDEKDS